MKKTIILLFTLSLALLSYAESFNVANSKLRIAIVQYVIDNQGFYQKQSNVSVDIVDNIEYKYAYDKKKKDLYVTTPYGNFRISLDDEFAKQIKKDKTIPQLKSEEIENMISLHNASLAEKFAALNLAREKHISDSINEVREQERIAREKARRDSIEKVNKERALNSYRAQHNWHWLPIKTKSKYSYSSGTSTVPLECALCDKKISSYSTDSIYVAAINNDTIFSVENIDGLLDNSYLEFHAYRIPYELQQSEYYKQHLEAYKDSLFSKPDYNGDFARDMNLYSLHNYVETVKKEAPYGLFTEWAWDDEYSVITFSFSYLNLNKRTIKYIDVYWKVTNDVGDVRKTGHFKGTGPLEQYETGSWNWDYSSYYVAGDASTMEFTKVIITYMNGQQQVLTRNMIKID